ncbi:MAG: response regulator [Verrucomicrobiota bacterium]
MQNQTILLVEDNEDDVFLMKRALKEANILNPLQLAVHGLEAVDYLAGVGKYADRVKHPLPSLIFLDLKLPFKHGLEVLQWIREQPFLDLVLVIVLTSSSEERDIQQAYRFGARSFLVKPPAAEMLLELMLSLKSYWVKFNEFPSAPNAAGS